MQQNKPTRTRIPVTEKILGCFLLYRVGNRAPDQPTAKQQWDTTKDHPCGRQAKCQQGGNCNSSMCTACWALLALSTRYSSVYYMTGWFGIRLNAKYWFGHHPSVNQKWTTDTVILPVFLKALASSPVKCILPPNL